MQEKIRGLHEHLKPGRRERVSIAGKGVGEGVGNILLFGRIAILATVHRRERKKTCSYKKHIHTIHYAWEIDDLVETHFATCVLYTDRAALRGVPCPREAYRSATPLRAINS